MTSKLKEKNFLLLCQQKGVIISEKRKKPLNYLYSLKWQQLPKSLKTQPNLVDSVFKKVINKMDWPWVARYLYNTLFENVLEQRATKYLYTFGMIF